MPFQSKFKLLSAAIACALLSACDSSSVMSGVDAPPILDSDVSAAVNPVAVTRPLNSRPASSAGVEIFSDFVAAAKAAPQTGGDPSINLFRNSGFENGLLGWSGCTDNSVALSGDAFKGNYALEVKPGNCFYRTVDVVPGTSYKLTCRVKLQDARAWTGMGIAFGDEQFNELGESPVAVATSSEYTLIATSGVAPAGSTSASMWLHSDHGALVDNCRLRVGEVSDPTEDTGTEELLNNGDFSNLDSNGNAVAWTQGCDGYATANGSGLQVADGACVDQSFSEADLGSLRNKRVTFSCMVDAVQDYADLNLFFDDELAGNTVISSDRINRRAFVSADVRWVSNGFVSLFANNDLQVSDCRLETRDLNGSNTPVNTPVNTTPANPNGQPVPPPLQTARYRLTFVSEWSASKHPVNFPANAHFSGLVGAVHDKDLTVWANGELASPGIKQMAETGASDILRDELREAINLQTALSTIEGGGIALSPGRVSVDFEVTNEHPQISVTSMIAPSPDWFIGIHNYSLHRNGSFIDQRTVNLFAYDAGTDSGTRYTSADQATQTPEPIARVNSAVGDTSITNGRPRIGQFRIERLP